MCSAEEYKDAMKFILRVPAIVKVNVKELNAMLEPDMEIFNQRLQGQHS